jgi:hypothetical protein
VCRLHKITAQPLSLRKLNFEILFLTKNATGHETVCGQTVTELIELLGLPDFLDGIVATARSFVCSALSLEVRSEVLQGDGYFDTLMEIFQKLLQLGKF